MLNQYQNWPMIGRSLVWIPGSPGVGLSYMPKYPWARYWTPELLLICSWHPVGQPPPLVRVLQWAGDSFRVYPGFRPWVELDLTPVSPASPQGDKKRQHPATLTEKQKKKKENDLKTALMFTIDDLLEIIIANRNPRWWCMKQNKKPSRVSKLDCL